MAGTCEKCGCEIVGKAVQVGEWSVCARCGLIEIRKEQKAEKDARKAARASKRGPGWVPVVKARKIKGAAMRGQKAFAKWLEARAALAKHEDVMVEANKALVELGGVAEQETLAAVMEAQGWQFGADGQIVKLEKASDSE